MGAVQVREAAARGGGRRRRAAGIGRRLGARLEKKGERAAKARAAG